MSNFSSETWPHSIPNRIDEIKGFPLYHIRQLPLQTSYKIAHIIKEHFLGESYRTEPQNLSSLKYYQGHQQYFQIKGDLCTFHPTVPGILGSMEVGNK